MAGQQVITGCRLGLRCIKTKASVCLKEIDVSVKIKGFIADVESCLVYENKEKEAVETDFVFPVDDKSAVYKFQAEIDGRTITAECQEKDQARETYKDAISSGHTAMMLSEDDTSGDVFQMKLGNLPPDAEAKLTISYVLELTAGPDGIFTYTLPTVLNPRYTPQGAPHSLANSAEASIQYTNKSYDFSFTSSIEGEHAIKSVTSTRDKLDVTMATDKKSATITLADKFAFDHDLSLDIVYEDTSKPTVILERGSSENVGMMKLDCLMLNFLPDLGACPDQTETEFIFVIDRSGSMGDKINQASETLLLLLKSLPVWCTFNIISFGSAFKKLFESPTKYDKESLKTGIDLQKSIRADMGGTEILLPLKDVYKTKPNTTRQLFLLTDGSVSNTHEVIQLCKKNAGTTRVFSFGIGSGISSSLINGVANVSGGKATFVKENDRLQSKVMAVLKCALQPAVTDMKITWKMPGDCKPINIPSEILPVFKEENLILYAVLQDLKKESGESSVTLSGKVGKGDICHTVTFDLCQSGRPSSDSYPVHRLAAKAQVKQLELEEGSSYDNDKKQKIMSISTSANIISKHTAFIGVDKDGKDVKSGVGLPDSLTNVQNKWRESNVCCYATMSSLCDTSLNLRSASLMSCDLRSDSQIFLCAGSKSFGSSPLGSSRRLSKKAKSGGSVFGGFLNVFSSMKEKITGSSGKTESEKCTDGRSQVSHPRSCDLQSDVDEMSVRKSRLRSSAMSGSEKGMMGIIDLQQFDGSWNLSEDLAAVLSLSLKHVTDSNPGLSSCMWATILALAFLQKNFMDKNSEWQMIESKARAWLSQQNTHGKDIDDKIIDAKGILS